MTHMAPNSGGTSGGVERDPWQASKVWFLAKPAPSLQHSWIASFISSLKYPEKMIKFGRDL